MSLFLQVAPVQPAEVKGAYDILLSQGPMGAICVLLIGALVFVFRALIKAKDDRLADVKEAAERLKGTNDASNDMIVEQTKTMTELTAAVTRSNDKVAMSLKELEDEQRDLRIIVGKLKDSQDDVESTVSDLEKAMRGK